MTITDEKQLAGCIDHTLLKATATSEDIKKLCTEAKEYGFCAVSVNPRWVKLAEVFCHNIRPDDFEAAFEKCKMGTGQYKQEANALWDFLREHDIRRIVEIGRHWGGNSFLMSLHLLIFSTNLSFPLSEGITKVIDIPFLPALPVRPIL